MQRAIHVERTFPHPPELVWRAVGDADGLGSWFMRNDLVPEVGRRFTFRMAPQRGWDGLTHCEVLAIEPGRLLEVSYQGTASMEKTLRCAGIRDETVGRAGSGVFTHLDTALRITLTPVDGGTRITLDHTGFRGVQQVLVSLVLELGWRRSVLPRLAPVLDRLVRGEKPELRPA